MTASVEIAQTLLPPVIAAFRKAYPAVAVDLVVTDRVADLVADGIDLAVRVGPLRDSSLISRAFVTGPSGLFASQAYLDRRGTPVSLEQLEHHDLIALSKAWARPLPMLAGDRKIGVDLTGGLACDDLLTVRALVAMGLGISFLPGYLAHQLDLVRVLPELRSPFTGLFFAYPAQKFVPARVREFIDFAASSVKRLGLHP
ncbi:substrate binding domain-containing protein [Mesorhizobium sp. LNJC403B00]|nr:substrate binding domain-containing protein [Mesorhizobium sp. LNJC403B00]